MMSQPIKKILLTTAILLVLYTLYLVNINPGFYIKQQQWQGNAIKAQGYLFGEIPETVIVGSSLSAKLTDALPDYYNLAFNGQGNCDGLRVILEKNDWPDTVLIEMNTLLVPQNEEFISNITNPALNVLRKNVLPFREGKEPLPLMVSEMHRAVESLRGNKSKGQNMGRPAGLFNELLAAQVKKYSVAPPAQNMQTAFKQLRKYVDALEARRVTVIFFELPVHPSLCNLPLSEGIRNGFFTAFPRNRYHYIVKPDCAGYKTTDGIHFTASDAKKYAKYYKNALVAENARFETLKMLNSFFR